MPTPRSSWADPTTRSLGPVFAFVRLSRPHFLLGGVLLHGVGAALAPTFGLRPFLWGQAMVTAAQLTAHYVNEHADRHSDRLVVNRTFFSGGSGVLSGGRLSQQVAVVAAVVTSMAALASAGVLATQAPAAALVVIPALVVSWLYSIPPVRLLSTGWGEVATSVVVAIGVPLVGLLSQGGVPSAGFWSISIPLTVIHVGMMLVFAIPDIESDRQAGKLVLAVRLGPRGALRLVSALWIGGLLALLSGVLPLGASAVGGITLAMMAAVGAVGLASGAGGGRYGWSTALAVAVLVTAAGGTLLSLVA